MTYTLLGKQRIYLCQPFCPICYAFHLSPYPTKEISHQIYSEWLAARPTDVATTPPPVSADVPVADGPPFIASQRFSGARAGYYFGTGAEGTGFYIDDSSAGVASAPVAPVTPESREVVLGLIGHPNVGKSSMVNHLMGEKVVSVKATPGHTKILQTLKLNDSTYLCDSPGVVFPRLEVPREAQIVASSCFDLFSNMSLLHLLFFRIKL